MKYKTKSIIVGRKKREFGKAYPRGAKPCFIALFDTNEPQKQAHAPKEILIFEKCHKVVIENSKEMNYLLEGNDLVVNDLKEIDVSEDDLGHLVIKCTK